MRKRLGMALGLVVLISVMVGRFPAKADEMENESLSACERYANEWMQQQNPAEDFNLHLLPSNFVEEKYEAKAGRQFISSVLSGNGLLQKRNSSTAPNSFRFTCLLEDWRTPVFFHMSNTSASNQASPDPAQQCWDQFRPAAWGELTSCLQNALTQEERKLKASELEAGRQATHSMERAAAEEALDVSTDFWLQYRDSECQRRQAQMAGANHPDVRDLTCRIQKTHQRVLDLQFDN